MFAPSSFAILVSAAAVLASNAHQQAARSSHNGVAMRRGALNANAGTSAAKRATYDNMQMTWYGTDTGACVPLPPLFFLPDANAEVWALCRDACTGQNHLSSDFVVAMNSQQFGDGSGCCGKTLTISYNGKSTNAACVDECPTCYDFGHLDMTEGLFDFFVGDPGIGVFYADWSYAGAAAPPPPPPTTTKKAPPPPTTTTTHTTPTTTHEAPKATPKPTTTSTHTTPHTTSTHTTTSSSKKASSSSSSKKASSSSSAKPSSSSAKPSSSSAKPSTTPVPVPIPIPTPTAGGAVGNVGAGAGAGEGADSTPTPAVAGDLGTGAGTSGAVSLSLGSSKGQFAAMMLVGVGALVQVL
ncbi:hypothetical protein B0H11DRAFT_1913622 [Mycena galericulata]|nr:hypothetical protein B0H11DRAFT_1913622 [Mycena galericulata]